jgi:beta-phosphoglucomutase-like phosphatase (HAD superfamily)
LTPSFSTVTGSWSTPRPVGRGPRPRSSPSTGTASGPTRRSWSSAPPWRPRGRLPIAVASNSPRPFVNAALVSAGLDDLFEHVISVEDAEHPKPAPDLYLAACAVLQADPARSVAFEDSATGVASARAAGMFVVGVPSQPGTVLAVDATYAALTDPYLAGWPA